VVVIGTGGTIAGHSESPTNLSYDAAQLPVDYLLKSIPQLADLAEISTQNIFSLNSKDMGSSQWLELARCIQNLVNDSNIDGVVVTHGTDTLEEAALFLESTISSRKPVVLTGSMRASTALSADGPSNLYQAIQVSASVSARDRGVLVVFNAEIIMGTKVVKGHSIATGAFSASVGGVIGSVYNGHTFFSIPPGVSPLSGLLGSALKNNNTGWPIIRTHYVTAGETEESLLAIADLDCQGIVIVGFGAGEIPDTLLSVVLDKAKQGVYFVISSRVSCCAVMPETMTLGECETIIASRHFNPQKSAVLLSLSLCIGLSPLDIFSRAEVEG
tara:strand:+ start:4581 stop:5567 length:987 start_codon:yes stop_codon:yes gene_type:complete